MEATTGTSDVPAAGFSTAQSENSRRAQLRAAGLRATKQRLAVLDIVEQRPHSTAGELVDGAGNAARHYGPIHLRRDPVLDHGGPGSEGRTAEFTRALRTGSAR